MNTCIVIDSHSICHRVRYTLGDTLTWEENSVGIIYGFLRQILVIAKKTNCNNFAFCWDSRQSVRRELYPQYKQNRHKNLTEDEQKLMDLHFKQFTELRKYILPSIGFKNIFIQEKYEADDIIARIVRSQGRSFIIVSTDNDLFQLIDWNVLIITNTKKPLFTEEDFKKEYDIYPGIWHIVKSIAGCPTDNVAGIEGVGIKTAIKYLNGKLNEDSNQYKLIREQMNLVRFNMKLIQLPYEGTNYFSLKDDKLSLRSFIEICDEYGFKSFLSSDSIAAWKKYIFR